jgi:hypothetical protein
VRRLDFVWRSWRDGPALSPPISWWVVIAMTGMFLAMWSGQSGTASIQEESSPPSAATVLIGVPGLRWQDITREATPNMYSLAADSSVAQLSVRSVYRVTCPIDGWLTLSAGRRAAAQRVPGMDESKNVPALNQICPAIPSVSDGRIADWASLVDYNAELSYNARLGQLADATARAGKCSTAVGPGAALALADTMGQVADYIPDPATLTTADVVACPLTVVDAATISVRPNEETGRDQQVAVADDSVGRVLSAVPAGATVLLAGVANDEPVARLQVLAIRGIGYPPGELSSSSTRLPGLVLLTDLTPTLYELLGLPPASDSVGAPVTTVAHSDTPAALRQALLQLDRKVTVYGEVAPPFFTAVVAVQLLLYSAAWAVRRRNDNALVGSRIVRSVGVLALFFAAIPVSTFLANLIPWWTWPHAAFGLGALTVGMASVIALLAQLTRRPAGLLGEATVVVLVTFGVLAIDVIGPDQLQTASLMGNSPLHAGRLYGLGNVAFSLLITSAIFGAAFVASGLLQTGRRTAAAIVVTAFGVGTLVVDGLPSFGSDFGGMLAILPAFAVLLFAVLDVRVTWLRALGVVGTTVLVVAAVATIDWLRPVESQTHLGRFLQQVLDGELSDIVARKIGTNLSVVGSSFVGVLVPLALLLSVLVLLRTKGAGPQVLRDACDRTPTLRPALAAWLVAMGIGLAVNDSGVAVPAVGIMLTIPILIVISTRVVESPLKVDEPAAAVPD